MSITLTKKKEHLLFIQNAFINNATPLYSLNFQEEWQAIFHLKNKMKEKVFFSCKLYDSSMDSSL